jgi:hypothetical protein
MISLWLVKITDKVANFKGSRPIVLGVARLCRLKYILDRLMIPQEEFDLVQTMATLDRSQCPAVESVPGKIRAVLQSAPGTQIA